MFKTWNESRKRKICGEINFKQAIVYLWIYGGMGLNRNEDTEVGEIERRY